MGCSANWEEGASLNRIAGPAFGRQALRSWLAGPRTLIVIASTILGATVGGYPRVASQAERGEVMNFDASSSRTGLPRLGNGVVGAEWLAARPHLKARAITQALRAREGPRGKRGRRKKRGWKHPPADAREDRTLEVVLARRRMSLQKSTADVLAQRNGSLHFNRFGGVRGRVPSSLSSRESVKAGSKETSVPDQRGSSHVTALEIGSHPRKTRPSWRRKAPRATDVGFSSRSTHGCSLGIVLGTRSRK
jgi:hypothetical protein